MNRPAMISPSRSAALRRTSQAVGIIVFGILMGIREVFTDRWQRALIAAFAFVPLAVSIRHDRRR